jgi:hypothetical protein
MVSIMPKQDQTKTKAGAQDCGVDRGGLVPSGGFDWGLVSWGGPRQRRTKVCSYCGEMLREADLPLILWKPNGACAEFCDACQRRYWGLEAFPDTED